MSNIALPMLFALLLWWFSTGVILYLDGLPRRSFRWSLTGASVLALLALAAVVYSSNMTTPAGAYIAFTASVVVWGWLEMSYLMGWVTGPWCKPCPPGVTGFARFKLALRTSLYHEAAVTAVGATLLVLCRDVPNPLAAHIFLVLWLMRWSSKLNVFLGVPNLNEEFLPEQLAYLTSFMPRRPMNLFFPFAVTAATLVTAALLGAAAAAEPDSYTATADSLLAALMLLAVLEHWFLVLPLQDAALWRWALQVRQRRVRIEPQLAVTRAAGD